MESFHGVFSWFPECIITSVAAGAVTVVVVAAVLAAAAVVAAIAAATAQWCDDTKALASAYIPRCSFFARTGIAADVDVSSRE